MITVAQLSYTYPGAPHPALQNVNFAVQPGEIFGFLGPSGAGKSTTQKILIKLLKGFAGTVQVMGKELAAWGSDYYEHIGVSFELPNHYQKLTALENLRLFGALYQRPTRDPMELLERVGLADDANTLVSAFSKGMQMRLNLVRALLHGPELLFLDEPTAGLDPVNARRVKEIALELKREGHTLFLTTHDMVVADELCDRVAFMVDGTLARIDSPRALKLEHGERRVRVEYRDQGVTAREEFALAGLGANPTFAALLREREVETIHTQEATLEDIFIRVTGRTLGEGG
jgi:fluoroquinolone transport system ATP-binding protein